MHWGSSLTVGRRLESAHVLGPKYRPLIEDAYEGTPHDKDMGGDFLDADGVIGTDGGGMQVRPPVLRRRRVLQQRDRTEMSDASSEDSKEGESIEEDGDIADGSVESQTGLKWVF